MCVCEEKVTNATQKEPTQKLKTVWTKVIVVRMNRKKQVQEIIRGKIGKTMFEKLLLRY